MVRDKPSTLVRSDRLVLCILRTSLDRNIAQEWHGDVRDAVPQHLVSSHSPCAPPNWFLLVEGYKAELGQEGFASL